MSARPAALPASPGVADRAALLLLGAGAFGVVLGAANYPLFDLDRHAVPKELALHATALLAGGVLLLAGHRPAPTRVDRWLMAFLAWSGVSALLATNHWLAFRAVAITASGLTCYWVARRLADAGLARALVRLLAVAVVLAMVTGLLQAYGASLPVVALTRAPGGTFGNRNFLAHFGALGIPLLLWVTLDAPSRRGAIAGQIGLGLVAALLVLSRSRAAWLGALACVVWIAAWWMVGARPAVVHALRARLTASVGILAFGVAAALALPNALDWKSKSPYLDSMRDIANSHDGSGRGRLIQYRNTLGIVRDDPVFGAGPGNWAVAYPRHTTPGDPAFVPGAVIPTNPWPSSDWVALLAERGAIAVVLLVGVALQLLRYAWRAARDPHSPRRLAALCGGAVLATLGVVGAFDAVLLLAPPSFLVWTALGALIPVEPDRQRDLPPRAIMALRIAAPLVLGAAVARSAAQWIALDRYSAARTLAQQSRAADADPGNFRIRMWLAGNELARGRSAEGCAHARAAFGQFPYNEPARRMARRCGALR